MGGDVWKRAGMGGDGRARAGMAGESGEWCELGALGGGL
jgi:hypothetical protein